MLHVNPIGLWYGATLVVARLTLLIYSNQKKSTQPTLHTKLLPQHGSQRAGSNMAGTEPLNEEAVPHTGSPRALEVEDKMVWKKNSYKEPK